MIKCPFCGATHVANTVFCSDCGNYLLESDQRKTDPLEKSELAGGGAAVADTDVDVSPPAKVDPLFLRLKIGKKKREVEVSLDKDVHIGRVDPTSTVFPEVDLTNDEDAIKSVSRRHARIFMDDNVIKLEDLGSINGTRVNGRKLDPYLPKILSNGDIIQLGRIKIEVVLGR